MKPLWRAWPEIKKKVLPRPKLIFLDFDGTLVPIEKTPDAVVLTEATKSRLRALTRRRDCLTAVISGRSLKDLRFFCPVKGLIYIGNHGLEMRGRGLRLPDRAVRARRIRRLLWTLAEKLEVAFSYLPGILIEDKGYTISIHYRNLSKEHGPAFREALAYFRRRYQRYPLLWKKGKKVWEIFPKIQWHKGYAALHLLKKFSGHVPIAAGDDRTDEDMFKALKRFGVTIRVGRSKKSCALYYLKSQKEVDILLEELCR